MSVTYTNSEERRNKICEALTQSRGSECRFQAHEIGKYRPDALKTELPAEQELPGETDLIEAFGKLNVMVREE